ncbi:unnamed protein product [Protopolystoma xenopodis]|uniref:Uncharacterized protein n=1 Tax=Protopolystoma xenopodis TaxID=117903 RepID=A0A3S5A609_9PLAT|nr:unnamed protein product [Protopolystoma xenopodis]
MLPYHSRHPVDLNTIELVSLSKSFTPHDHASSIGNASLSNPANVSSRVCQYNAQADTGDSDDSQTALIHDDQPPIPSSSGGIPHSATGKLQNEPLTKESDRIVAPPTSISECQGAFSSNVTTECF